MKQISILLWIGLTLAVARLGWVWLVRHDAHSHRESTSQTRREQAYQGPRDDGNGVVGITQFYARSGEMTVGDSNLVCYGVRNARSVRIEPPVENLTPALNRCFFIEPQRDTTYKLVAEGTDGSQASESFRVRVKPAPPWILLLATSEKEIRRGQPLTLCYGVENTKVLRVDPIGIQLPPSKKNCAILHPAVTATYTLIATGDGGTHRQTFTVTVR